MSIGRFDDSSSTSFALNPCGELIVVASPDQERLGRVFSGDHYDSGAVILSFIDPSLIRAENFTTAQCNVDQRTHSLDCRVGYPRSVPNLWGTFGMTLVLETGGGGYGSMSLIATNLRKARRDTMMTP